MDVPFVFGLEFELAAGLKKGVATDRDRSAAYDLIRRAVCQLSPWLSDGGNGVFTPGFRLYLDAGNHTEVALVEVSSPRRPAGTQGRRVRVIGAGRQARPADDAGPVALGQQSRLSGGNVLGLP